MVVILGVKAPGGVDLEHDPDAPVAGVLHHGNHVAVAVALKQAVSVQGVMLNKRKCHVLCVREGHVHARAKLLQQGQGLDLQGEALVVDDVPMQHVELGAG